MNDFFTYNFNISKVVVCVFVAQGTGQRVHNCRLNHGLVFQINGVKKYTFLNSGAFTAKEGEVFYLPKFSYYTVDDLENGDCIAINFELSDKDITFPYFRLDSRFGAKYGSLFKSFLKAWNLKENGYLNKCYKILYEIICSIQADAKAEYLQPENRKKVGLATEYIIKHLSRSTLTIYEISGMLGMSPEYFRRIFKAAYGVSPKKYIMNMRIEKAKELILSEEFKIGVIGDMCGFESESYFSREFKRSTALTPTE